MNSSVRGVIFDLGSTLFRFEGDWSRVRSESHLVFANQLVMEGLDLDVTIMMKEFAQEQEAAFEAREKDFIERTTASIARSVVAELGNPNPPENAIERALVKMYGVSEDYWTPVHGVHEVLQELLDSGLQLGLISNAGDNDNVQRLIDLARLRSYFDPILVSAEVGIRKPDRRIFELVLNAWDLTPQEVVMVGDDLGADIRGAQWTGMHQIWLKAEADPNTMPEGKGVTPEAVAETLADVPEIIDHMTELAMEG